MQHNDGKVTSLDSLLGVPCACGLTYKRGIWASKLTAIWGTEPSSTQQLRYVGIQ